MSIFDPNFATLLAFMAAIVAMVSFTVIHLNPRKGKVSVEVRQDASGNSIRTVAEFGRDNQNSSPDQPRLESPNDYRPPFRVPPIVESVSIPALPKAATPKRIEKKPPADEKASKPKRRSSR